MNDFLSFSRHALNLLDNKIHNDIKGSFVDNFIHELQEFLNLKESNKILENLPKNTNLHFAKFEGDYAVCFDYSNKIIYNIPKAYFNGTLPETGDAIKCISPKYFCIDYEGIPASKNSIDDFLNECTYSNISASSILPEYYKISEINNNYAVCKNLATNKLENIPIDDIPENSRNGDTLFYKNGKFNIK